ncbi:MAG: stress response translation initiation inhibitor YciH [Thermoplasmatota archaeon]
MSDIFEAAGLPDELQDFDSMDAIAMEQLELRITTDTRRYGKVMTIVSGIDDPSIDKKKLLTNLKSKCACGGAIKDGHVELQGEHTRKVQKTLEDMGFQARID